MSGHKIKDTKPLIPSYLIKSVILQIYLMPFDLISTQEMFYL